MECGLGDIGFAQKNARAEEAQQGKANPQVFGLGVGDLARRFEAMNDQAACIGLEVEQMPVEGGDFDASAGRLFEQGHEPLADKALPLG